MKTNQEVADAWAMGYSAKSSNMFTDGETIYSYGYHFPIATRVNGHVLFNHTHYSVTTSKHQSHVRRAMRGDIVYCRDIGVNDNERYTRCFVERLLRAIPKCRKIDDRVADVMNELFHYGRFLEVMREKEPKWYRDVRFALSNLHGKALRVWCKNYKF